MATCMLQECQAMLKTTGRIERTGKAEDASYITEHIRLVDNELIHQQ